MPWASRRNAKKYETQSRIIALSGLELRTTSGLSLRVQWLQMWIRMSGMEAACMFLSVTLAYNPVQKLELTWILDEFGSVFWQHSWSLNKRCQDHCPALHSDLLLLLTQYAGDKLSLLRDLGLRRAQCCKRCIWNQRAAIKRLWLYWMSLGSVYNH